MSRKQVKNHFAFVYSGRPESYNANNTRKNIYKKIYHLHTTVFSQVKLMAEKICML